MLLVIILCRIEINYHYFLTIQHHHHCVLLPMLHLDMHPQLHFAQPYLQRKIQKKLQTLKILKRAEQLYLVTVISMADIMITINK